MLLFIAVAAIKGSIVIVIALIVNRTLLRSRSAASRHAVWSAALAAQLLLLVASPAMPAWNVPMLSIPSWLTVEQFVPASLLSADFTSAPATTEAATTATIAPTEAPSAPAASRPPEPLQGDRSGSVRYTLVSLDFDALPTRLLIALVWAFGTLYVVVRYLVGTAQVARLARTSERVEDGRWLSLTQRTANRLGIARPLTLLRGNRLGVPVTWGIVYPVVLLPEEAQEWSEERREFVLIHEMAHVKRLDALTQVVAQFAEAVFWFNPFVWYAGRQARLERERACDDYVLVNGTRASFYADELLGMVRRIGAESDDVAAPGFAALAMARRSEFEGRMLAILDPAIDRRGLGSAASLAAVAAALVLTLPLAALQPFSSPQEASAAII